MRLAREAASQDEADGHNANLEAIMENNTEDDKIYAAMGVAKTVGTVSALTSMVLGARAQLIPDRVVRRVSPRDLSASARSHHSDHNVLPGAQDYRYDVFSLE
jgi:hypothetical protein